MTLIAVVAEGEGWIELELLHRPWWRRVVKRPRTERIRVVGIVRQVPMKPS